MPLAGVYEIRNLINGDRYIGSSQDIGMRFCRHLSELKHKRHHSVHLQRAWNKYGEKNFEMEPLIFCDEDKTLLFEQILLDELDPEYNIAECAEASARGAKRSKETRQRISEAQKGRKRTSESVKRSALGHVGLSHTEKTKKAISKSITEWHKTKNGKLAVEKLKRATQRKVKCLETGKIYLSIKSAAEDLNVNRAKVSAVARGERSHTGGYRFVYAGDGEGR